MWRSCGGRERGAWGCYLTSYDLVWPRMTSYGQPGTAVLVLRSRPRRALRAGRGGGEAQRQRQGGCGWTWRSCGGARARRVGLRPDLV